jgi:hypothetical protein
MILFRSETPLARGLAPIHTANAALAASASHSGRVKGAEHSSDRRSSIYRAHRRFIGLLAHFTRWREPINRPYDSPHLVDCLQTIHKHKMFVRNTAHRTNYCKRFNMIIASFRSKHQTFCNRFQIEKLKPLFSNQIYRAIQKGLLAPQAGVTWEKY